MTDKTFEDRLTEAVVAQFFAPQWRLMPVYNPSTGQAEQVMQQHSSPAAQVAYDIFAAQHIRILEAVKERLDVNDIADALADKVVNDVVTRLTASSSLWSANYDKDQAEMREMVNRRIADELARRALEKMDAEQADADASS